MKSANDSFDGLSFSAVDSRLFFTRNDPQDPRLGDLARALPALSDSRLLSSTLEEAQTPGERHFVIAGYPDDEGIRTNGGRPGAALAPDAVRKPLYKMTPPLVSGRNSTTVVWDAGNLHLAGQNLETRHAFVSRFSLAALSQGSGWIGIGGGHDYGFPDADAFIVWAKSQGHRPLILNFDAHLDVRPANKGISSGTPFFRMLEKHPDVDFAEIGIQAHCNSRAHLEWVTARGARVLMQEEIEASGESFTSMVLRTLDDWALRPRPVFLSVDIDGFSSSVAPGCSQSWATGFMPDDFFPCLQVLAARFDIRALGIYEVSPPLDQDDRTAKLAAQIVHRVIS
jgi:formiminoglutamase